MPRAPVIDAIVLAAGQSARLGQAKQLLRFAGRTLVARAVAAVAGATPRRLLVVVGARAPAIRAALATLAVPVEVVDNPDWQAGIGSSIRAGLQALDAAADPADGVLLAVCDQPLVEAAHFARLAAGFTATPRRIVASYYAGSAGVPALFPRDHFAELRDLPATSGARRIIARHAAQVVHMPCAEAAFDVDTGADYKRLLARAGG
jgi:molybdenum cofactor cytidylyltransferase